MGNALVSTTPSIYTQLQEQLEYAPPASKVTVNPSLAAWRIPVRVADGSPNPLIICAACAARVMACGFGLPPGTQPIWRDEVAVRIACPLCGTTTEPIA